MPEWTAQCVERCGSVIDSIPGDVIEFGADVGSTTFSLSKLIEERAPEKRIYACDTFAGFPYDDPFPNGWQKGQWNRCQLDQFLRKALTLGAERQLVVVPGAFEDALPFLPKSLKFCFAWVDADLGPSTATASEYVLPRLSPGAIIGFHDYRKNKHPGVQQVVDSYVRSTPGLVELGFLNFSVWFKYQ